MDSRGLPIAASSKEYIDRSDFNEGLLLAYKNIHTCMKDMARLGRVFLRASALNTLVEH